MNRDIHRVEWERQKRDRLRSRREERERSIWKAERLKTDTKTEPEARNSRDRYRLRCQLEPGSGRNQKP